MEEKTRKSQATKTLVVRMVNTEIVCYNGYLVVRGYVINKSSTDLDCLLARVDYFSFSNTLIKTADMVVDDAYLKPKEMSLFSIVTPDDERIGYARISFKLLMGPEISLDADTKLQVSRKTTATPFIDFEIRKNITPKTKKN
jgi:hypothetical protein